MSSQHIICSKHIEKDIDRKLMMRRVNTEAVFPVKTNKRCRSFNDLVKLSLITKKLNDTKMISIPTPTNKQKLSIMIPINCNAVVKESKPSSNTENSSANINTQDSAKPNNLRRSRRAPISYYDIGEEIGKGAYASVMHAIHKETGKEFAVKVYNRRQINSKASKLWVDNEIKFMRMLDHPNIVKLYNAIETNKEILLFMELVRGQSLEKYVTSKKRKRLSEREAIYIFKSIIDGIACCHEKNIVHRDIKMTNILLDEDYNPKIIDFGFSTYSKLKDKLTEYCGTNSYMAPEIEIRREYLGQAADVWSLGILLYTMITGFNPFRGRSDAEELQNKLSGKLKYPDYVSDEARNLIGRMLKPNQEMRCTVLDIMNDPLLKNVSNPK